jgi:putative MFS transporter
MDSGNTITAGAPAEVVDSLNLVQRVDRFPVTRYFYLVSCIAGAGVFFDLFDINTLSYTIAALRKTLNLNSWGVSLTIVMVFIGMAIGSVIFGRLAEAIGRRPVFGITIVLIGVGSFMMFLAMFWTNLGYIYFARIVTGLGIGGNLPVIWTYASEMVPTRLRGRTMGVALLVGGTFTGIIGTNLASWLLSISLHDWGYEFLCGALVAFLIFPLMRALPESPRWYLSRNQTAKAEEVLTGIEARVRREYGKDLPTYQVPKIPHALREQKAPWTELFQRALFSTTTLMILWFIFYTLAFYGWQSFYQLFMVDKGYPVTVAAHMGAMAAWFGPVGPVIGFLLADRLERRYQLMIYAAWAGIMALLLAWAPFSAGQILVIAIVALAGMATGAWTIPMYTFIPEVFPARVRSTGSGLTNGFGRASNVVGVLVVGVALAGSLTGELAWIAGCWVVCIAIMYFMGFAKGFKTTGVSLENISEETNVPETIIGVPVSAAVQR